MSTMGSVSTGSEILTIDVTDVLKMNLQYQWKPLKKYKISINAK